jgi:hypothetical protein
MPRQIEMSDGAMNASQSKEPALQSPMSPVTGRGLWKIFIAAVAIRWGYDIALYAFMGRDGLMVADSYGYLSNAETMAKDLLSGGLHGWAWLGSDLGVMPLYPWFLTLNVAFFGALAPLTSALMQGLIDSTVCLLVFRIAQSIDPRIAWPAAIAAVINPTQIVLSGMIYNDTMFLFFAAAFLAAGVAWLRQPSWPAALAIGFSLGLAALDRIVVAPWAPVFGLLLLAIRLFIDRLRPVHFIQIAVAGALFGTSISPMLIRNVTQYDAWSLTPQGGAHLALWVAPLVRQAKDGTPWAKGSAEIAKRKAAKFGTPSDNPFVDAGQFAEIGRDELAKLGYPAIAKAWIVGTAINLATPAVIISPPIAGLPRTGFFATQAHSVGERIVNFLFHSDNAAYAWALLLGLIGVAGIRAIQSAGILAVLGERRNWPAALVLALWTGFILAANGPIASPKYRLPIEPMLCVLTGAGVVLIRRRFIGPA